MVYADHKDFIRANGMRRIHSFTNLPPHIFSRRLYLKIFKANLRHCRARIGKITMKPKA